MSILKILDSTDVIILGSGVSALVAAKTLIDRGKNCLLLESSPRMGGAITTFSEEGYRVDFGPNTLQLNDSELETILQELGCLEGAIEANRQAHKRFLVRGARVITLPQSVWQGVTNPLLSFQAKMRVFKEPFIKKYAGADEALGAFVQRRLGQEFLDYLINPMVGGVYAGLPENLSVRYGFPKIYQLEQSYGSLLKGAVAKMWAKRKSSNRFKTRLLSWPEGMYGLVQRLAVGLNIATEASIEAISQDAAGIWHVTWLKAGVPQTATAPYLAVTTPTHTWKTLPFLQELPAAQSIAQAIEYPPVTVVALGYRRDQVQHALDGFGLLIPACEGRNLLGALFSSTLFPDCAPEGHVLLTVFVGGARQPSMTELSPADLQKAVHRDLSALLNIQGEPKFCRQHCWANAIPQYQLGYERNLEALNSLEERHRGLHLIGNYRDGIALGKCMLSAHARAFKISEK